MNGQPLGQTQILLIKASEDEVSLRLEGQPIAIAGFHAQQAVEKLMKALLSQLSVPFELTHDLGRLATALGSPIRVCHAGKDTVRLIREHILARIAALSA